MNKKTIYIIIGLVVIAALGFVIYFWLNSSKPSASSPSGSPFGNGGANVPANQNQPSNSGANGTQTSSGSSTPVSGLREIAVGPVSGATIFASASSTLVRYVDRTTGNIYEYNTETNTTNRITNTTMPKIVEVAWGSKGNSLVMRFLNGSTIESYFGIVLPSTGTTTNDSLSELSGNYLPENINALLFSPLKDKIFYTVPSAVGIEGFVADKNGGNAKSVWQFPTTEWVPQWITENTLALTTKATNGVSGSAFVLNLKNGALSPIISNIPGLTTLVNPDGNLLLYSQSQGSNISLSLFNAKNDQTAEMPFVTLPEKCLWENNSTFFCAVPNSGMGGNIPDAWYEGFTSFNDNIWQGTISETGSTNNTASVISNLGGNSIDAINLALSPDNKNLIFENKKDYSLWLLPIQ
jgi:hypothetical protein